MSLIITQAYYLQENMIKTFIKRCGMTSTLIMADPVSSSFLWKGAGERCSNEDSAKVPMASFLSLRIGRELSNLKPGPGGGSCGNAVFKNEAQFVQNTFEDNRWVDLRQLAIDFNLCSCWSLPILNDKNEAIGTFALSSFEHRSPAPFHKKLLETGSAIIRVVLKNQSNEERIQLFSTAIQRASEGMLITELITILLKPTLLLSIFMATP
jgi:hypothetical protein